MDQVYILNFTKNELKDLFEKIDSGKFKDASIQNNRVIESLQDGITVDAYGLYALIRMNT